MLERFRISPSVASQSLQIITRNFLEDPIRRMVVSMQITETANGDEICIVTFYLLMKFYSSITLGYLRKTLFFTIPQKTQYLQKVNVSAFEQVDTLVIFSLYYFYLNRNANRDSDHLKYLLVFNLILISSRSGVNKQSTYNTRKVNSFSKLHFQIALVGLNKWHTSHLI